jgi:hypothetical protein
LVIQGAEFCALNKDIAKRLASFERIFLEEFWGELK